MDAKEMQDQKAGDRKADIIAIVIIFGCLMFAAVHFISGWTF
ncbi:MAG: hypothetical protein O7E57_14480 [Gammaproteobacteria bacterium]|nr:hypothetical protein [Gammaproteobacteria bacterium]